MNLGSPLPSFQDCVADKHRRNLLPILAGANICDGFDFPGGNFACMFRQFVAKGLTDQCLASMLDEKRNGRD